jgi:hypothetical protein
VNLRNLWMISEYPCYPRHPRFSPIRVYWC